MDPQESSPIERTPVRGGHDFSELLEISVRLTQLELSQSRPAAEENSEGWHSGCDYGNPVSEAHSSNSTSELGFSILGALYQRTT